MVRLPEKPKCQPIHRWENGFELLGLPELPAPALPGGGGALGLIGGFGKTTALLILSGKLDPSCGWYALVQKYQGTRLGDLLRRIEAQELKVSYKPQAVERLRHLPDLHRDISDLKIDFDIAHALRVADTMDAEKLDASELQRISIAASLSKDAELYLMDEPSAHLDISQRRLVAKLIKEKGKKAPVIVADSDITFIRLACDSVALFYGDENWSMPSAPYSPKEAIGAFVSGTLPDGTRIRPRAEPGESPEERERRMASRHRLLLEFAGVQKRFDGNVLQADGEILENERVGILGADGAGKSTLLKIFAGKEKEFSGMLRGKPKVSYKPQHLPQRAVLKGVPKSMLKMLGIPLRGHPRLTPSLRQRIAIARCLGADAELYILDQPSDGLRAEERLIVAELLRSKPSVLVADHDAWLVARVADRCGLVMRNNGRSRVEWLPADDAIERIASE